MMNNLLNQPQQSMNGINPQQFQKWLPQINNNMLQQLMQQARQQGMNEKDIQAGVQFINSLRSRG